MLLLVVLQWFCLLPRDNCQFLVVLLPALGFSITARDPEPSEKHFKKYYKLYFQGDAECFHQLPDQKSLCVVLLLFMVNAFFCGEIFFCLCCVYKCVAYWAVSKFSFYSVVASGVSLGFLTTTPCVPLDPGTTQNNEQRSHQPIISEGTISSNQADSTKSSQFHQSKPRLFLPPTMFHQSSKLGEKRKFQL